MVAVAPRSPAASSSDAVISSGPRLPWDLLVHVLRLADTHTLATIARVSRDFLIASTPLFYRHIRVDTVEALESLFSARNAADGLHTMRSRADSPFCHIRTLTVDFQCTSCRRDLVLSTSRFPQGRPLHLDLVHLLWLPAHLNRIAPLRLFLLPILNPVRAVFEQGARKPALLSFLSLRGSVNLSGWSRLEALEFKGRIPLGSNGIDRERIVGLPRPTLDRRRVVRLHLGGLTYPNVKEPITFTNWLRDMVHSFSADLGLDGMQENSVVLVVWTEAERIAAVEAIQAAVPERQRNLFTAESENESQRSTALLHNKPEIRALRQRRLPAVTPDSVALFV